MVAATATAVAQEEEGFYPRAGAGFTEIQDLDGPTTATAEAPTAAFGGYRFNEKFGLEGFYADVDPQVATWEGSSNFYTQSLRGQNLDPARDSSVAGVSAIATLHERGPIRPFARAGLHHYDLAASGDGAMRGGSLLLGAGAFIELKRGWNARLEWERYSDIDELDRNIFSASFQYDF